MADKIYSALLILFLVVAVFLLLRAGKAAAGFWIAIALAAVALVQLLRLPQIVPANLVTGVLLGAFLTLIALSTFGLKRADDMASGVQEEVIPGNGSHKTLFVLIHGFGGGSESWPDVIPVLQSRGDVLRLDYPNHALSNADPKRIAADMSAFIQKHHDPYSEIVVIGHSVGALLARKTYLIGIRENKDWARKADRLVLMAGMNRGWDVTGKRPMDMSVGHRLYLWFGAWVGRLTNTGKFILSAEMGAPFVSDLRLEWMRWFRSHPEHQPVVVQLLGDIDNLVSDEDNKDLRPAMTSEFYWLRVRGTGHMNILDFHDTSGVVGGYAGVGAYRKAKFTLALDGQSGQLAAASEEQHAGVDERVTHLVFVLHGIRDLGEWSASFEQDLRKQFPGSESGKLAIVSPRYGYFSMGSFVFQPNRQKYVRWLMDQYTEYLARYPHVEQIDFFAHSNGTYLLASALDRYHSLKASRVVFAGSVVRKEYNWAAVLGTRPDQDGPQVGQIRNYVARDDMVVGLFPRFFEFKALRWLKNDVGSAGFNGFDARQVENVRIAGGHSGFLSYIPDISRFLLTGGATQVPQGVQTSAGGWKYWFSRCGIPVVWALLILLVVFPGVRVAVAAGEYAWVPVSIYLAIVFLVLKRL